MPAPALNRHKSIYCKAPDILDSRHNAHLLVWPDLAQWLVVDDELLSLLKLFDGKRTVNDVFKLHAKQRRKPYAFVETETSPVIHELAKRAILSHSPDIAVPKPKSAGLVNITLNLTNRCNLECSFCYNSSRSSNEMDIDDLMDRLTEETEIFHKNASFIILGGEPFLDPERLFKSVDKANTIFTTSPPMVSTNGTLLDKSIVKGLSKRRVEVQVSIDSHDPVINDDYRGKGSFDRTIRGIRQLVDAGVYTIVSMVLTKNNAMGLEHYLDMATELGVNEARFIPMRLIGKGTANADICPDQGETLDYLMRLLEKRPEIGRLLRRDYFSILMTMSRLSLFQTGCGAGSKVIFIDADGKVYPCPNHVQDEFICGDLADSSLAEIVGKSTVLKRIQERYHVNNFEECRDCSVKSWCAGDCRGEVLALTGNPYARSPHCKEIRDNFIKLFWYVADCSLMQKEEDVNFHMCF